MKKLKKNILVCILIIIFNVLIIGWLFCPRVTTYKGDDVRWYINVGAYILMLIGEI